MEVNKENADPEREGKAFPKTPVARVAFADLVGGDKEEVEEQVPSATPGDAVSWRFSPRNVPLKVLKGQKRARSSSPLQSQEEPIDAADVERRLFPGMFTTPSKPLGDPLGHSSSPNTPAPDKLRRTQSCGTHFLGGGKRRKTTQESSSSNDIKSEKLKFLLDKVNDGLASSEPTPQRKVQKEVEKPKEQTSDFDLDDEAFAEDLLSAAAKYETQPVIQVPDNTQKEEMSEDDFDDDFAEELGRLTQAAESTSRELQRFVIEAIFENQYQKPGRSRPETERVLQLRQWDTETIKVVLLRDSWLETPCTEGVVVHIVGNFVNGQCVVDDSRGFLVLHPDHLLSATVVADSFQCTRRAVLQDRVKSTNEASEAQVFGHILHEIFQGAMSANRWDDAWLAETIERVIERYVENLYEIQMPMNRAASKLREKVPGMQTWARQFLSATPKADINTKKGPAKIGVGKLLDVEEHVWSPRYGLKGNIDATVQVSFEDESGAKDLTVPLEVKTGRAMENISHKSQTALYTLLLSDRYDVDVLFGLLLYTETSAMSQVLGVRLELIGMIQKRNEIASYIRSKSELPPMLRSSHTCGRCYSKVACFTYHKLVEDGNGKTSGLGSAFEDMTRHLKPEHAEFFRKWEDLLTKEEGDILKFKRELWTMSGPEREKTGRCFSGLTVRRDAAENFDSKINRYQYVLAKARPSDTTFVESQLNVGEPIVISDEKGHYALANGYITKIRKREISVAVDRRLHNARVREDGFDPVLSQRFSGIMSVGGNCKAQTDQTTYRLDRDEFGSGMATIRNNLVRTMERDLFQVRKLRELIIELAPPKFNSITPIEDAHLNEDQRRATAKVLAARDYALVLGMPGTGKTTTIAHIIRTLVARGKSVLLASYTHTAVDNILLKIKNDGLKTLRVGAESKIHPEVARFAELSCRQKSWAELEDSYASQVVATTCLGINHPIFGQRIFDYCIVDEASQITLPVCLGPIRMAHRFVLVGDHFQLPPLVQNEEAREGGLDVSLFKLLSEKHPESVVNLEHQYRMCADIMLLSNTLIYDGHLKCGTEEVANRKTPIPDIGAIRQHHHTPATIGSQPSFCLGSSCWLRQVLEPAKHVTFVNTDPLNARETVAGSRVTNEAEVILTRQVVQSLLTVGVAAEDIGVITLYRSQLALLKQSIRQPGGGPSLVEMHTADKFQGRDKETVVLSLVRSNDKGNIGELLQDWRRVNVALTRARTKLIIVGSFSTISRGNELLGKFCKIIMDKRWRLDLKPDALGQHYFEDWATQSGKSRPDQASSSPRKPERVGKIDIRKHIQRRPVLRDIANEAIGL